MPMRVTFNFDRLNNAYLNDTTSPAPSTGNKTQLVEFIKKQADAASLYIQHLIKIVPATLIKFPNYNPATCGSVTVPSADVTTGLNDSDLHIYVNYEYNTTSTYLAFASMCVI